MSTPEPSEIPQSLFAPWRLEYLEALEVGEKRTGVPAAGSGSFLLDYWRDPAGDESNHVVVRTGRGLVLLNRFPYAGGHLLVALGEPAPTLIDYSPEQRAELWRLTDLAAELMQRTLEPQGINFGINQGRAAGAGVPQHLHVHLVPRWNGDINFMGAVGNVRVIPASLEAMTRRYREEWGRMRAGGGD
jgi:ATP adenylyltransferase